MTIWPKKFKAKNLTQKFITSYKIDPKIIFQLKKYPQKWHIPYPNTVYGSSPSPPPPPPLPTSGTITIKTHPKIQVVKNCSKIQVVKNPSKNLYGTVKFRWYHHLLRDGPLFFIGRLPFLGLADNFFWRVMHFKQCFSLHFVMKTIFLQPFLKNITGYFIDLIWKKNTSCACMHMKSHLNETN